MLIPVEKATNSIVSYLLGEVNKVPNLSERFVLLMGLGAVRANPMVLIRSYEPKLRMTGILTDEGVDTDSIRSGMDMAFANIPNITVAGFTFTKTDADEVLRRMER